MCVPVIRNSVEKEEREEKGGFYHLSKIRDWYLFKKKYDEIALWWGGVEEPQWKWGGRSLPRKAAFPKSPDASPSKCGAPARTSLIGPYGRLFTNTVLQTWGKASRHHVSGDEGGSEQEHPRCLCAPPFLTVGDNKGPWLFKLHSLETGKSVASSCPQEPGVFGNHGGRRKGIYGSSKVQKQSVRWKPRRLAKVPVSDEGVQTSTSPTEI